MKVLALSGSLRKDSSNFAILKAVQKMLPAAKFEYFDIGELPFFIPEQQYDSSLPQPVENLRRLGAEADFLLVACPEYAHSMPGVLKNALEWLFHEGTQKKKAVAVFGSAGGGLFAKNHLKEVLRTMDFLIEESGCMIITTARRDILSSGEVKSERLKSDLQKFVSENFKA